MSRLDDNTLALLRLTLTPGLGPVLVRRLLDAFGSPQAVAAAATHQLARVRGIGSAKSAEIREGLNKSAGLVAPEVARAADLGIRILGRDEPAYPPLLAQIPDAPPVLYCRGTIEPDGGDKFPVAIVGARECSAYGVEQARRFGGILAGAGLTVVSGGARGIDSAAHRGALAARGRTICVQGCGLAHAYPPENQGLFDEIAGGGGAVVSELPIDTPPRAENFPARNRIIAGLCLGVVVIEAGERSGALITARLAAEDYGREVMALPGRVDAPASRGTLKLLKQGGAALVTEPGDVLALLESPAHHVHSGSHRERFSPLPGDGARDGELFDDGSPPEPKERASPLSPPQLAILGALDESRTIDELMTSTGLSAAAIRAELTVLEIQQRIRRSGTRFERAG